MSVLAAVGAATNFDRRSDYSQWGAQNDFVCHSSGGSLGITTTDDDARLICYDAAVDRSRQSADSGPRSAPPAPVPAQAAAAAASASGAASSLSQEDLFGKSGDEVERTVQKATGDEPIDSLTAMVTKLQQYSYDKVLISLDNGQVWKQVDASNLRLRVGDAIEIERASLGSFMLKKQGSKRTMRVSRED